MAKVKLNAEVVRTHKGGFKAVEKITTKTGDTIDQWWTVWSDAPVQSGQKVEITGDVSVRTEEYNNEKRASAHVNNAVVKSDDPF